MSSFYFERECRTPNSECYTILEDGNPIDRLDLHFTESIVHATLVVGEREAQQGTASLRQRGSDQSVVLPVDQILHDLAVEVGSRSATLTVGRSG